MLFRLSSMCSLSLVALLFSAHSAKAGDTQGADWVQFRGPRSTGVSTAAHLPLTWSETENLRWKAELPGAGASSPIVLGDRIFVTCYSGYGLPKSNGGDMKSLQRQIVCISRDSGQTLWANTVAGELPEDQYQGYLSEHGYASGTPVTDGERVYCFFGKSGVVAYDLEGKPLWKSGVGKESSNRRWGSGASLILYKNMVIVNASEESQSLRALDQKTGKEVWKAAGAAMELAYGTPALIELASGRTDLVVAVPGETWGLNPDTGKIRWFEEHTLTGNICPSIVADGESVYVFGGFRSAGSLSLRLNGSTDAKKPQVLWTSRNSSYVATPALFEGHLYWVDDRGQAFCINAKTGEPVYRERVTGLDAGGRPVYASPIVADGKIYIPSRWNGVLVLAAKPKYEVLAQNRFASDESDFNATPAICGRDVILRSNRFLYCVSESKPR